MNPPFRPPLRIPPWIAAGGLVLATLLLILSIPLPRPLFPKDYSRVVYDENGRLLRAFLSRNESWIFPPDPSTRVPEKLRACVLLFEDERFAFHPGVDPLSLARAVWRNLREGRITSGASTVTMQLARRLADHPRTVSFKFLETIQSLKLELLLSKEEILSTYLDHAPYGGNVVGYRAACWKYFQKDASSLTWAEAATLAVLPNAPGAMSPVTSRDRLLGKRDRLLRKLHRRGRLSKHELALSLLEPLPSGASPLPFEAPHLAQTLVTKHPGRFRFSTTIQWDRQARAARVLRRHSKDLSRLGIRNAAVLVADTRSRKVRAYLGSDSFDDSDNQGQVDGLQASRSPGSTLKPFLYALAIDEGLLTPDSRLKDTPVFYGGFSPHNSRYQTFGLVTMREALLRSLNIPAVRTLADVGTLAFCEFLREAGLTTLWRPPDEYGLSLILGGAEVRPVELAGLYAALGNGGRFRPLRILSDDAEPRDKNLLSPEACRLVLDVLREVRRPGEEAVWARFEHANVFAWKTGTSLGQRDAWAVGVNPRFTILVWVGNFRGDGNPNLTGAESAGSVLVDLFREIDVGPQDWFPSTERFEEAMVCAQTGYLAGPDCPEPKPSPLPKERKAAKICPWHRKLALSADRRESVCDRCWRGQEPVHETRLIYPPDVTRFMRERGIPHAALPPHRASCPRTVSERKVEIQYPAKDSHLSLPVDFGGVRQKLSLRASHQVKDATVFWFLNREMIAETRGRHEINLDLARGTYDLRVEDAEGGFDETRFQVE